MVFLYFLFSNGQLDEVEVVGIKIVISDYFEILTPPVISILILFYIVVSLQKAGVQKSYNLLFQSIFGISPEGEDMKLAKQTLPPGILFNLINQNDMDKPKGCFYNILVGLPLASIQFTPYVFIVYSLVKIYDYHFDIGWGRISFFLTIYFLLFGSYLFFKYIIDGVKEDLKLKELEKELSRDD